MPGIQADDRPRDPSEGIYRVMCWKFLSTGKEGGENRVNETLICGAIADRHHPHAAKTLLERASARQ